jgi:hypothetical protein
LYKCGYSKESIGLGDNRYIKSFQTLVSSVRDGKARTIGKIIHTKREREREGEREKGGGGSCKTRNGKISALPLEKNTHLQTTHH